MCSNCEEGAVVYCLRGFERVCRKKARTWVRLETDQSMKRDRKQQLNAQRVAFGRFTYGSNALHARIRVKDTRARNSAYQSWRFPSLAAIILLLRLSLHLHSNSRYCFELENAQESKKLVLRASRASILAYAEHQAS